MEVYRLCLVAICVIILAIIVKSYNPAYSVIISLALSIYLGAEIVKSLSVVFTQLKYITGTIAIEGEYIGIIFKVLGITYVTEFASDICKENGFITAGNFIELICRISVTLISLPIVMALFETVNKCIK